MFSEILWDSKKTRNIFLVFFWFLYIVKRNQYLKKVCMKESFDEREMQDFDVDETEIPLNDIYPFEEKTDVDMSDIFVLSKLQTQHLLGKKSLLDLQKKLPLQLNFSLRPKMKLFRLKHPFHDITVKKKKDVVLTKYKPKITPYTLDLLDLETLQNVS